MTRTNGDESTVVERRMRKSRAAAAARPEAPDERAPAVQKQIIIPKLDLRTMQVRIVGDAALIVNRFSEKSKRQMFEKQTGVAGVGHEFKDPAEDYEGSLHRLPGQAGHYGFPAQGFKKCAVTACTSLGRSITKEAAKQAFHVLGDLIEIVGTPSMREDMVRVGRSKAADLRYRAEFKQWSCTLTIRYNTRVLSDEQIINLFNVAGFAVGVGEWRPEKNGQFGLFHVE